MGAGQVSTFTVCPRCDGFGTVANPTFDGASVSEMREDWGYEETDDFLSEYTTRGGMYDVACPLCNGRRVATESEISDWEDDEAFNAMCDRINGY